MSRFDDLERRFDALQPRERLLLSLTAGVLLVAAIYVLWIEPSGKAARAAHDEIETLQPQVEGLRQAVATLEAEVAKDPEVERRAALERLRAEASAFDARFRDDATKVIAPHRMPGVLREMLGRDQRLHVVGVRVLTPEALRWSPAPVSAPATGPVPADAPAVDPRTAIAAAQREGVPASSPNPAAAAIADAAGIPVLYRHRVALSFEGDYAAALDYVRAVEALPYRLRLQRLDIDATRWPVLSIELEVETLGLAEGWIGA